MSRGRTILLATCLALPVPAGRVSACPDSTRVQAAVAARAAQHAVQQQNEAIRRELDLRRERSARKVEPAATPPPAADRASRER
jgi:hypothetical protein